MLQVVQGSDVNLELLSQLAALLRKIPHRGDNPEDVLDGLMLCMNLGQLRFYFEDERPQGMVSWLRAEPEHVRGNLADVKALPVSELIGGPCLLIVEIVAPGLAYSIIRTLARLPGVERVCGNRPGGHFAYAPVAGKRHLT